MECILKKCKFPLNLIRVKILTVFAIFAIMCSAPVLSQDVPESLRFATGLYQQRRYDLAAEEFQKFIAENKTKNSPDVVNAQYALATCRLFLGQYAESRQSFEDFLKIAPPEHPNLSAAQFRVGETSYLMGDMQKAEGALARYLDQSPKDHPQRDSALVYAGDVSLRLEHTDQALSFYELALKQFPKGRLATRARFGLGRCLSLKGRHAEALNEFKTLQETGGAEWSERAWYQIVLEQIALKNLDDAQKSLAELVKVSQSGNLVVESRWMLALALLDLKKTDEAAAQFAQLAAINPPTPISIQAASRLSEILIDQKKGREALELLVPLLKTLEGQPSAVVLIYQSAEAQILVGDKVQARERLIMMADQYPADAWADDARLRAADLAMESQDWSTARTQLTKLTKELPNSPLIDDAKLLLARVEAADNKPDAAKAILEPLVKNARRPELKNSATYQLALVYRTLKQDDKARELLAMVTDSSMAEGSAEALLLLGQSAFESKKYAESITALEKYLKSEKPRLADHALSWLSIAQWETGAADAATSSLKTLVAKYPKSETLVPTYLRLGEAALESSKFDLAAEWLQTAVGLTTDKRLQARIYTDLGYTFTALKKSTEAASSFAKASQLAEGDEATAREASMAAAKVLSTSGKPDEALKQLDSLLASLGSEPSPVHGEALLQKARLLGRMKRTEESARTYGEYAGMFLVSGSAVKDTDQILSEWAYALLDSGKVAEADQVFERLLKESPKSRYLFEAKLNLAETAYSEKNYAKVKELLADLVKTPAPEGMLPTVREAALYRMARAELDQKNWENAQAIWNQIIKEFPKSSVAHEAAFWLGEIAVRTDRPDQALKILEDLLKELSANEKPAWIPTAQLRRVQALTTLKRWEELQKLAGQLLNDDSFKNNPELVGELHYAMGRSYQATAMFEQARKSFQTVIDTKPPGDLAAKSQFMRGETYFHEKNYREALREFLKVDILHNTPVWQSAALLEGGKVYEQLNQPADAADLYNRLLERFPNEPAAAEAKARLAALKTKTDSQVSRGS